MEDGKRNTKEMNLGGKRFIIKELTMGEIKKMVLEAKEKDTFQIAEGLLSKVSGLSWDDLENFTASEIKILVKEIKEMHSVFFEIPDLLKRVGLETLWSQVKKTFQEEVNRISGSILKSSEPPKEGLQPSPKEEKPPATVPQPS